MSELWALSAHAIADGIRQRHFSSTEVAHTFLQRIETYDRRLRSFITVDAERVLADARDADQTVPTGSLHGVPIAVKDNIDTADLRTTGGSRVFKERVPDADAPVVASLKAQGAIVLGKTNLHEFAYGGTCTNVEFGAVRNPWNLDHVPGGSSGGSGAADGLEFQSIVAVALGGISLSGGRGSILGTLGVVMVGALARAGARTSKRNLYRPVDRRPAMPLPPGLSRAYTG